jgi:hypothetical protein
LTAWFLGVCPTGASSMATIHAGDGLRPEMLVSLTAPKLGAKHFQGKHHYIGGRFIPPQIAVSSRTVCQPLDHDLLLTFTTDLFQPFEHIDSAQLD